MKRKTVFAVVALLAVFAVLGLCGCPGDTGDTGNEGEGETWSVKAEVTNSEGTEGEGLQRFFIANNMASNVLSAEITITNVGQAPMDWTATLNDNPSWVAVDKNKGSRLAGNQTAKVILTVDVVDALADAAFTAPREFTVTIAGADPEKADSSSAESVPSVDIKFAVQPAPAELKLLDNTDARLPISNRGRIIFESGISEMQINVNNAGKVPLKWYGKPYEWEDERPGWAKLTPTSNTVGTANDLVTITIDRTKMTFHNLYDFDYNVIGRKAEGSIEFYNYADVFHHSYAIDVDVYE